MALKYSTGQIASASDNSFFSATILTIVKFTGAVSDCYTMSQLPDRYH